LVSTLTEIVEPNSSEKKLLNCFFCDKGFEVIINFLRHLAWFHFKTKVLLSFNKREIIFERKLAYRKLNSLLISDSDTGSSLPFCKMSSTKIKRNQQGMYFF